MSEKRKPTSEKLAKALEQAKAPADMITRARANYYDDYKSDLAFPIKQLVEDARKHKLYDIATRAMNGEFDATKEDAEEWAKSPEGRAAFKEFGHLL